MPGSARQSAVRNLARAAAAGPWDPAAVADRLRRALGGRPRGLAGLARRLVAAFPDIPAADRLVPFLQADPTYPKLPPTVAEVFWSPAAMGPRRWDVPPFATTADLAGWLGLTPGELDWFADAQGRNPRQREARLQHYAHVWVPKRGGRFRLLEIPKPRLKAIQRRVLHEILDRVPAHPAAHGFRAGRSILTFAAPHAGRAAVWRVDLKDFFPSVPASRVHALFAVLGYPPPVARALTGLCTTQLAFGARPPGPDGLPAAYRNRHLPQGAPTSPALANLAAYRLDLRLASWAAACGAAYTRYADDLAFSGGLEFARARHRFRQTVLQVILEEGFRPNAAKSRWMTPGGRQHLAGVVVNRHPNVRRDEYDRLKAILTNCLRHGAAGQNRDGHPDIRAHLLGRIAHVSAIHPARGRKLRAIADRVDWSAGLSTDSPE
jgi:RNA-directed DNA polymerase